MQPLSPTMNRDSNFFILSLRTIVVIALFGISWPINKIALNDISPLWCATLRLLFATLVLFIYVLIRKELILPSKRDFPILFSGGVLLMGIFVCLINLGLQYLPAGRSVILVYTTPLWVTPVAVLFFREKLTLTKAFGLLLGLLGVVVLLLPTIYKIKDFNALWGCILLLTAALIWSCAIIHFKYTRRSFNPIRLAPWQLLIGALIAASLSCRFEPNGIIHWTPASITCLSFLVFSLAFCFVNLTILNRIVKATTMSMLTLGVPIVGFLSSLIMLHEPMQIDLLVSIILIILGIAMTLIKIDLWQWIKRIAVI